MQNIDRAGDPGAPQHRRGERRFPACNDDLRSDALSVDRSMTDHTFGKMQSATAKAKDTARDKVSSLQELLDGEPWPVSKYVNIAAISMTSWISPVGSG